MSITNKTYTIPFFLFVISSCLFILNLKGNAQAFPIPATATSFCIASNHQLYIGTLKGLYQFKEQKFELVNGTENHAISCLSPIEQDLFFGTKKGYVLRYKRNKLDTLVQEENEISKILHIDHQLYIGTKGSGFTLFNLLTRRKTGITANLPDLYVNDLIVWQNLLLLATDRGIASFDFSSGKCRTFLPSKLLADPIVIQFESEKNTLRFTTSLGYRYSWQELDSSLVLLNSPLVNKLNATSNITASQGVLDSITDIGGHQWLLKREGLLFRAHIGSHLINRWDNTNINYVHALYSFREQLVFTPNIGLSIISPKGNLNTFHLNAKEKHIDITSFYADDSHSLWIGTMGSGLYQFNLHNNQFHKVAIEHSVEGSGILSITGKDNFLCVSSLNGTWISYNALDSVPQFESLEAKFGFKKFYVYKALLDSKNRLWLATDGQGVLVYQKDGLQRFQLPTASKTFYSIIEDRLGQIWFNSQQEGLFVLKNNNKIEHLHIGNGLFNSNTKSLASAHHYVVAAQDSVLTVIDIRNFSTVKHALPFSIQMELNASTFWHDQILIGSDQGIYSFHLPKTYAIIKPSAALEQIVNNNGIIDTTQHNFSYEQNTFLFQHSVTGSLPNQPVFSRYKLEGYNKHWTNTADRRIYFAQLQSGRYTYVYQIANNPEFLNPASFIYHFEIRKPFWQTWWFIGIAILSAIGIVRWIIRYRIQQVTAFQKIKQEKQLAEFDTLKSQVNPHFLFNSFNSLLQLIEDDKEKALNYTAHLSDLYRNVITFKDQDVIPLEEEIKTLENYIYLHKIRYNEGLQVNIDDLPKKRFEICPLTLQLLVENAIKHNSITLSKPLEIKLFLDGAFLVVQNNLNPKLTQPEGEGMGLENIRKRYKNVSKQDIQIEKNETSFTVKIPLIHR